MQARYPQQVLSPIHRSTDLAYAHSSHMDVFFRIALHDFAPPTQLLPAQELLKNMRSL